MIKTALLRGFAICALMITLIGVSPNVLAADIQVEQLFETHCSGCHLNGGNIIRRGKNLKLKSLEKNGYESPEAIADIIANGKNNMSAFSDRLSAAEITQLADYVLERANQGWA